MPRATVTGDRKLNRALQALGNKSGAAALAGVRAGLAEISKAIKQEVPTRIRPAIAHRLKKNKRTGLYQGKAGGGVGSKRKTRKRVVRSRPGVGISKSNVHWYLLGTTGRQQKNGRRTGYMPPNNAVRRGASKARGRLGAVMRKKIWERIQREVQRAK